jgi:GT2 family glycosyltransferase
VDRDLRFTIVTPVYNGMPWLPEAVSSVAEARSSVDVEHLTYDAGSTDGSREWLAANAHLGYDVRMEPDEGQTDALAKGFARATGSILGWLNADDVLEPGALSRVRDEFARRPDVVMVCGPCLFIDPSSRIVGAMAAPVDPSLAGMLKARVHPPQPSTFFRAEAYRAAGGLDRTYDLAMDVDLWLRIARQGSVHVVPDVILSRFRIHPAAKSERYAVGAAREDLRARRREGMRWRSRAGAELLYAIYVEPVSAWVRRAVRRPLKRLFGVHTAA